MLTIQWVKYILLKTRIKKKNCSWHERIHIFFKIMLHSRGWNTLIHKPDSWNRNECRIILDKYSLDPRTCLVYPLKNHGYSLTQSERCTICLHLNPTIGEEKIMQFHFRLITNVACLHLSAMQYESINQISRWRTADWYWVSHPASDSSCSIHVHNHKFSAPFYMYAILLWNVFFPLSSFPFCQGNASFYRPCRSPTPATCKSYFFSFFLSLSCPDI